MPRSRKPETVIAELRRELKGLSAREMFLASERDAAIRDREKYRAVLAESVAQAAEWKRRFDALLARVPLAPLAAPEPEGRTER